MPNENEKKDIYIVDSDANLETEHEFNIMPEEFFNSKYQQSRVRKEQQMQKEKELIDKKKREREDKLKRLNDLEKQRKEKYELKKERERIKEEERKKKQEELDIINKKKQEELDKIKQERDQQKKEQEEQNRIKLEKKRRLKELDQKSKEERKNLKKEQKELLKQELEKRAMILRSRNNEENGGVLDKDVEKALSKERIELLKKIKLEQKLNKKEQSRIKKELKEEEKRKAEEALKALESKIKLETTKPKKHIKLDFVDDGRVEKINNNNNKKRKLNLIITTSLICSFALFGVMQSGVFNKFLSQKNKNNNSSIDVAEDFSIRLNDVSIFSKNIIINNSEINYLASFNDRRDIESVNFEILKENSDLSTSSLGVFTFNKENSLNRNIDLKISNINCENYKEFYLNYFDVNLNKWEKVNNLNCVDDAIDFDINNYLYSKYAITYSDYNSNNVDNYDSSLGYSYKYKFSRFYDFFGYKINGDSVGNYLSLKESNIYSSTYNVVDSDGDGYLDGEEVINLYDPSKKIDGQSLDMKLFESGKISIISFGSIDLYYPSIFKYSIDQNNILKIDLGNDSNENISLEIVENINSFQNFLSVNSEKTYQMNSFMDNLSYNFYVNNLGNNVYLDIGDKKVLKVSYNYENKENVSYASTLLMIIKSIYLNVGNK